MTKKLSPAVLAALGLTGCIDSCNPTSPLEYFQDGDQDEDVHPCLNMVIAPEPPIAEPDPVPDLAPCLKIVVPERVGPCLRMVMPIPVISPVPVVPPVILGPCLSMDFEREDDPSGAVKRPREDIVALLREEGVLPADVTDRLTDGTGRRRPH